MSNEFTRSFVGGDGKSLKDSAYQLTRCVIVPRDSEDGGPVDIRRMIGFIRIHESLFNPSLFFEIGIRDDYNFFEEFGLSGNEIISLEFETKAYGLEKIAHEYEVHVTKINDYARGDSQVQAYTLIGVSSHAFNAPLMPTNMVCHGITTEFIRKLCNSLGLNIVQKPDEVFLGGETVYSIDPSTTCISKTHTVFGTKNPLQAALELLSVSFDEYNTPYFLYQTLSNVVYLAPLSWINDRKQNPVYRTFTYTDQVESDPSSELEYFERSSQITKLTSNLGASPVEQLVKGAGPRHLRELNLNTKEGSLPLSSIISSSMPGPVRSLAKLFGPLIKPYIKSRFTSPWANDDLDHPPISVLKANHADDLSAQVVAYDSFSHQFSVMGDMLLNPGRTIKLEFPKTLDPVSNPTRDIYDNRLSQDYLIFQAVHTFQEGKHTTAVTAKTKEV